MVPSGGDGRAHVPSCAVRSLSELATSKSGRLCKTDKATSATVLPLENASYRNCNTPQRAHDTADGVGLPICWIWLQWNPAVRIWLKSLTAHYGAAASSHCDLVCMSMLHDHPSCCDANPGERGKTDSGLGSAGLVLTDLRFISRTPLIAGISLQNTGVFRVWPGQTVPERHTYGANYRAVVCQTNSQ
jgi:hypothetical protein